jgi:hypothetical protein
VPALFHAGGAHGIRPSELSPFGRFPSVSARVSPPTVSPSGISRRPKTSGRPNGSRFLGFWPSRESLAFQQVFSPLNAGCSLGLRPSRVCGPRPCPGFRRNSSLALRRVGHFGLPGGRLRVSIGLGLAPSSVGSRTASGRAALLGFLRRLGPDHLNCCRLRAMRSPFVAPTLLSFAHGLWRQPGPTEAEKAFYSLIFRLSFRLSRRVTFCDVVQDFCSCFVRIRRSGESLHNTLK